MKIILLIMVLTEMCYANKALDIEYDKVFVAKLKYPLKSKGKRIFSEKENLNKNIDFLVKVLPQFHPKINKLFGKKEKFDNGLGDINLQLYSLVFYNKKKLVLTVSPNILGADLNATDSNNAEDARSLSKAQLQEFLMICHISLALNSSEKSTELPSTKSKLKRETKNKGQRGVNSEGVSKRKGVREL